MPPRPRKAKAPSSESQEWLAKIFGITKDKVTQVYADERPNIEAAELRKQLEAESVLYFVEVRGAGFKEKPCKECGEMFAHPYQAAVAYCGELCRANSCAKLGIDWNPTGRTDIERWGGKIPKVLSPEALKAAKEAASKLPPLPEKPKAITPKAETSIKDIDRLLEGLL